MSTMTRKEEYRQKMKDPRWQKRRLHILERDKWTCQACESGEDTLHVHHRYYIPNTEPWDHPDEALVTLCEVCHENESRTRAESERLLLHALKEKLFGDQVHSLAGDIHWMQCGVPVDQLLCAVGWVLSTPSIQPAVVKMRDDYLAANNIQKGTPA